MDDKFQEILKDTNLQQLLKDAIIAEVASDVLKIRDDLSLIAPLVTQLKEAFPTAFDALQGGLIETLEQINEGIKEAGGERVQYVSGQLHIVIEQAIQKAFSESSEKVDTILKLFEKQNGVAVSQLRGQFGEVSKAMTQMREEASATMKEMRKETSNLRFPIWAKITIPIAFIVAIGCTAVVSWKLATYTEAVYMNAFMKKLPADKAKGK